MTKTAKTTKTRNTDRLQKGWTFRSNPDLAILDMVEGRKYRIVFKNSGYAEFDKAGRLVRKDAFKSFATKSGRGFDLNAVTADGREIRFQIALFGDETEAAFESGWVRNFETMNWDRFTVPAVGERFEFYGKYEIRTIDLTNEKVRTQGPQLVAFEPSALKPVDLGAFPERPDIVAAKAATNKANAAKNRRVVEKSLDKYAGRPGESDPKATDAL